MIIVSIAINLSDTFRRPLDYTITFFFFTVLYIYDTILISRKGRNVCAESGGRRVVLSLSKREVAGGIQGNAPSHEIILQNSCGNDDAKRARLAERFAVMAKAAYWRIATKIGTAENHLQRVAQKMAQIQRCMQIVMQNTVQKFMQKSVQYNLQKLMQNFVQMSVQIVMRKKWQRCKFITDAELRAVVRAELFGVGRHKGTKRPTPVTYCINLIPIWLDKVQNSADAVCRKGDRLHFVAEAFF